MQGFSFETFQVSDANRAACEWCQSAAAAPDKVTGSAVLLGPEGSGKSHLLWSMVKSIRASETPTGLALIMPGEFPEKVRQLIEHPEPIQGGRTALLLVDGLERFREELPALESVVEVFLANRQPVILSSNVHPQRLARLSSRMRAILSAGRIVELQPEHGLADDGDSALLARIRRLEDERAQLKADAARRIETTVELARLREALAGVLEENNALKDSLELAAASEDESSRLMEECERLRHRVEELELGTANAGAPSDLELERTVLRARLAEAQREADGALAQQALLQGQLTAARQASAQFDEVIRERDRLAADLRQLREDAEAAVAMIEARASEGAQLERRILKSLENFTVRLFAHEHPKLNEDEWTRLEAELGDARSVGEAFRKQLASERAHFQAQLSAAELEREHLEELLEESRGDQGRLSVALDSLRGRVQATDFELEKARKQLALQHAEMDALRHEAASQVASANMQAGAMEHRLTGLEETFHAIREAGKTTGADVRLYSGELANMASVLDSLATRLARLQELTVDSPASASSEDYQGVLFDPDTLRIRATFQPDPAEGALERVAPPRRDDRHLRAVVEQALALDEPGKQESA
ncbi:MAG: hypothetical protein HYV27_06805 [Candidatus Hydrogenedentes bacterium]|nr:hypothetical protein [Candidatus Hydrogenedentota bacterium]